MPRGRPHGIPFKAMGGSPSKRLVMLRFMVMGLIKHERIEGTFFKLSEAQKYADQIINIAKTGPSNKYCNDMVKFWTNGDEEASSKLFNVLVPRYSQHKNKFSRLAILPSWYSQQMDKQIRMAVLELKGNPLPPLPRKENSPHTLQNVLIASAKNAT